MELTKGLHLVGNDLVAMYLVHDTTGITLIDAGLSGQWKDLQRELAALGRSVDDIRAVLLTHGDPDHIGIAERLRREHGVPVFIHPADSARARGLEKTKPGLGRLRLGPLLRFIAFGLVRGGLRTEHVTELREYRDGETLQLPGRPNILALPGHSPGSVAIHVPAVDAVFVGDGLTTRHVLTGRTGPQPAPFTDNPDQALASLERLRATGARWVLPGHGAPWGDGIGAAIDAVVHAAAEEGRSVR